MPNVSTLETLVGLAVLAVVLPLGLWLWRKAEVARKEHETAELAELEKERSAARAVSVRQGTHDGDGRRLCITCQDKVTRATQPPFLVRQSEGWWDLVRRTFGAPARYIISQAKDATKVYCELCATLVRMEHEEYVLRYEKKLREGRKDAALELRRWLRHGCNDVVAANIEKHDERVRAVEPQPKRATVTTLHANGDGG